MNYIRSKSTIRWPTQKAIYSGGDSAAINQAIRPSQSNQPKYGRSCQATVTIYIPGPKPSRRAASRKRKAARHEGFDKQQINQMLDELRDYETALDDLGEEDFDDEIAAVGAEVGVSSKDAGKKTEKKDDEEEDIIHFGLAMCMSF